MAKKPAKAESSSPASAASQAPTNAKQDAAAEKASGAVVTVTAKPERGRWRAGRYFTRTETSIPLAELSDDQLAALEGDPELIVSVTQPE